MTTIKIKIKDIVLKKGCAEQIDKFYDPFAELYLLPLLKFEDATLQLLVQGEREWLQQVTEISYNNTRLFRGKVYDCEVDIDHCNLQLYLVNQPEDWPDVQQLLKVEDYHTLINCLPEHYLLACESINLQELIKPIYHAWDNELIKGALYIIGNITKTTLPLKYLPTVFKHWEASETIRPYHLEPVGHINEPPPGMHPKVTSSVEGKMETFILFFPSIQEANEKRVYCYSNFVLELMDKMGKTPRHFILAVEHHYNLPVALEQQLEQVAANAGHLLEIVSIQYSKRNLSPWVQDACVTIQFENTDGVVGTYLVESASNYYYTGAIQAVVEAYRGSKKFDYYESALPFVGGNILSGDDFVLIGLHYSSKRALEKVGSAWLGTNYIVLSSTPTPYIQEWGKHIKTSDGVLNYYQASADDQTLFHLDLFVTLAGKGVRRNTIEYIVVAAPEIGFEGLNNVSEDIQEIAEKLIAETTQAIEEIIEQIKAGMQRIGKRCKIIRNPLPLTYYDQRESIDGVLTRTRYWCWASYNNCLVEQYKEGRKTIRRTFLPSYGGQNSDYSQYSSNPQKPYGSWRDLQRFDEANQQIWEQELGYEVVLLEQDFNPFIRYQGSLNCLTHCIERK